MPQRRPSNPVAICLVLGTVAFGGLVPAHARSPFDGRWYVVIRTVIGSCMPTVGYKVLVRNGKVFYDGGGVRVGGRIDDTGRVNVGIRALQRWAHALGRVSRHSGGGTWRGTADGQVCSGRWQAHRSG
jgi:hypothetical protein